MLIFQRFSSSHIVCDIPAFSFKVRIATLTRNQLIRKGPWVRIPPSPPPKKPVIKPIAGFFSMCFSINKWSEHTAVSTKVSQAKFEPRRKLIMKLSRLDSLFTMSKRLHSRETISSAYRSGAPVSKSSLLIRTSICFCIVMFSLVLRARGSILPQ